MRNGFVLITGASSGLGKALSISLSKNGYHCILASRNKKELNKLSKTIKSQGNLCTTIPTDLTSKDSIDNLYSKCLKIGFIEMIIHNAGIGIFSKVAETSMDDFDRQIDVNLKAPFILCKKFIPHMKEKSKGRLVFINSVAGKHGYPYSSAYVSSKFGLRGLSESLRLELRSDNIKVISVHPGAIDTPFWNNVNADFPRSEMLSADSVANDIVNAIESKGNSVIEEIVIRRNKGDF